ncbi:tripartite tricarboxylate transporter substrate binding protein [Pseudorhodoferax sp. Leaf274]|uniref:Bug family tripartite tricarboxylate transporter substrate binding protein n=1 Tax=Pseudorhodoferax sp. Leaf274 TaxID=1736318 RepID=UPI000703B577|nr:tripartite tricarboxylate transporter substrate binding protein [Pseudorhodoferax sp. Leaf274]KQP35765.1 LacI family transcriptional regulator [Pseudorhodoferax sp. Leaf274]
MQRRTALAAGIAGAALLTQGPALRLAQAQGYPAKPIRLVVPFSPGGVSDTAARVVAEKLGQQLGQQVIVDNKPGASGNIGTQQVAQAEPDGYNIVLGYDGTLVINPHLQRVPFDTVKDFAPVGKIGDAVLIIVVNPKLPVRTFAELVAYAKAQPGGLSYGSAGTGSTPHLAGELLKQRTGIALTHIPYKGGGQAMGDVVGGTLPMLYTAVAGALPFVKNQQLRAIAVSSAARVPSMPDVPTLIESGVKDFVFDSWVGLMAPARTPRPVIDRLNQALQAVLRAPDTRDRLQTMGVIPTPGTPEAFGQQIAADLEKNRAVVQGAQIKIE